MRRIHAFGGVGWKAAALAVLVGCTDRLPTLSDSGRLPAGLIPVTIEHIIPPADFLTFAHTLRGVTGVADSDDYVVARDFDGSLQSHVLSRFREFPDSLLVEGGVDREFTFLGGHVRSSIADSLAASASVLTFYLWRVAEPWDSTATWTHAVSRPAPRLWQAAGGTPAELLAIASWSRADTTAARDTLVWVLSGEGAARLASNPGNGVMVTLEDEPARAEITHLSLTFDLRSSLRPDTVFTRPVPLEQQTFVFTPEPPAPQNVFRVGGITSDRQLLGIRLPQTLPGCPAAPGATPACDPIAARDAVLNRVDLVFDPVPVTLGFRPVGPIRVLVRRLLEPQLGVQAPLGRAVTFNNVPGERFVAAGAEPTTFVITSAVAESYAAQETELGLALQVEPEASTFGYAWFGTAPRLRFIYTLPQQPRLP